METASKLSMVISRMRSRSPVRNGRSTIGFPLHPPPY
jgi:hypothetical protein